MHCWNVGCEGGPALDVNYCVGMGYPETFREAGRIMREQIRPCLDAARRAGVLVCHVEADAIALQHPEALPPCLSPASAPGEAVPGPVVPGWQEQIAARSFGQDYATRSGYATMDRAAIVAGLPGEPYVYQTSQFDRLLREQGIENLIYSGFATDMCILRAPGGIEPMFALGYRTFLMRDATIGVECPDTFAARVATNWAVRYFETHFGDTVIAGDFIQACSTASAKQ
jgi:nicotinamidase-related amidase